MNKTEMKFIIKQYNLVIESTRDKLVEVAESFQELDKKLAEWKREPGDVYQPESYYHELTLKMGDYISKRMFFPESLQDAEVIKHYGKLYDTNREAFNVYLNSSTHRFLHALLHEEWEDKGKLREFMLKYSDDRISGKFNVADAPVGPFHDLRNSVSRIMFQEREPEYGNFNLQNMLCFIAKDLERDIYTLFLEQHLELSRLILESYENIKILEKMMQE